MARLKSSALRSATGFCCLVKFTCRAQICFVAPNWPTEERGARSEDLAGKRPVSLLPPTRKPAQANESAAPVCANLIQRCSLHDYRRRRRRPPACLPGCLQSRGERSEEEGEGERITIIIIIMRGLNLNSCASKRKSRTAAAAEETPLGSSLVSARLAASVTRLLTTVRPIWLP